MNIMARDFILLHFAIGLYGIRKIQSISERIGSLRKCLGRNQMGLHGETCTGTIIDSCVLVRKRLLAIE